MCRWIAYVGPAIPMSLPLVDAQHSLLVQSLNATEGAEPTNGDGFGVGWYSSHLGTPGVYHDVRPAWNDENFRCLASHIRSHMFLAHIRAADSESRIDRYFLWSGDNRLLLAIIKHSADAVSEMIETLAEGRGELDARLRKFTRSHLEHLFQNATTVRLVLRDVESLIETARGPAEPLTGELRLSVIPTIAPFILPPALPRLFCLSGAPCSRCCAPDRRA